MNNDDLDEAVAQDVGNFDEALLQCKGFFFWSGVEILPIGRAESEIALLDVTVGGRSNDHVLRFEFNEVSQRFGYEVTTCGVFFTPVPQTQVGKGARRLSSNFGIERSGICPSHEAFGELPCIGIANEHRGAFSVLDVPRAVVIFTHAHGGGCAASA